MAGSTSSPPRHALHIALESPDPPELIALTAELDACQASLHLPESRHPLAIAALTQANVAFLVARDAAGCAAGRAALVLSPAFGDVKRLHAHRLGSESTGRSRHGSG